MHTRRRLPARALIQSLNITHVFNRLHAHTQQWLHTHTAVGKKKNKEISQGAECADANVIDIEKAR